MILLYSPQILDQVPLGIKGRERNGTQSVVACCFSPAIRTQAFCWEVISAVALSEQQLSCPDANTHFSDFILKPLLSWLAIHVILLIWYWLYCFFGYFYTYTFSISLHATAKNLSCSGVNPYGSFKNENMNNEDLMEDLCYPSLEFWAQIEKLHSILSLKQKDISGLSVLIGQI